MTNPARAPSWLANLALAIGSLLVFGTCAEVAARTFTLTPSGGSTAQNPPWLGNRWMIHRKDYRDRLAGASLLSRYYDLYQWDRFLFYRLRPHRDLAMIDPLAPASHQDSTTWRVTTNASGFRSGELRAEPGVPRIVSLGDSSTFGWGVEADETYPQALRRALVRRHGMADAEVINLGVPGYSTFQGAVLLETEALALNPDLITWSYLSNDGAATGESDRETFESRRGLRGAVLAALHHSRAFETLEAWIVWLRTPSGDRAAADPTQTETRNITDGREAAENIRRAVTLAQERGVPLVLVAQCVRPPTSNVLLRVAAETGTPLVDATGILDAMVPRIASEPRFAEHRAQLRERWGELLDRRPSLHAFLPDGCHPNPLGHRIVGERMSRVVATLLEENS